MPFDTTSFPAARPQDAADLETARKIKESLSREGWCKSAFYRRWDASQPPSRCIIGWIAYHVAGDEKVDIIKAEVAAFISRVLGSHSGELIVFNDDPRTTRCQVIQLFGNAITCLERAHG